ncbi:glycosyltransferase family 4 protein [Alloyangia pacifica]|uniref:glycosyltransferase family 4 protein n=1 Tax=Alloyangia pacifica TaxID=311180 RepID=UPI001CFE3DF1|nr:glycosyltransferase family 4 protein [Alloyangia pacifica]
MKILMISARADLGGGPEHLFQLCRAIGEEAEIYIACPNEEPYWEKFSKLPNVVGMVKIPKRKFTLNSARGLSRFIRQQEIDIIHSHGKGAGVYSRVLSLVCRVPTVHTFHGLHIGDYGNVGRSAYLFLERVFGLTTSLAICVSHSEKNEILGSRVIQDSKIRVVYNGVEVSKISERPHSSSQLRILNVNRFNAQKNPKLLLDVVVALKSRGLDFHLKIIGKGDASDVEEFKSEVDRRGLNDCVELVGPVNNPRDYYRNADVFISTSLWEGLPLAVLEAMSEGSIVVATDVVGNRDAIRHEEDGILFPVDDPNCAALSIANLSEGRRQEIRTRAVKSISEKFSVEGMARSTLSIYRDILEDREKYA